MACHSYIRVRVCSPCTAQIKKLRKTLENGEVDSARELLRPTLALVDRSVQKGLLHDNAAARTKSRLTRLLDQANAEG